MLRRIELAMVKKKDEEVFELDDISSHMFKGNKLLKLVKWKRGRERTAIFREIDPLTHSAIDLLPSEGEKSHTKPAARIPENLGRMDDLRSARIEKPALFGSRLSRSIRIGFF